MRIRHWDITFLFSLCCSLLINTGMVGIVVLHTQAPKVVDLSLWHARPLASALAPAPAAAPSETFAAPQVTPPPDEQQPPAPTPKPKQAPPPPPEHQIELDNRDAFGEDAGTGQALNSSPGDQPLEATKGTQIQAYLGRTALLKAGGGGGSGGAGGTPLIGAVSPAESAAPRVNVPPPLLKMPPAQPAQPAPKQVPQKQSPAAQKPEPQHPPQQPVPQKPQPQQQPDQQPRPNQPVGKLTPPTPPTPPSKAPVEPTKPNPTTPTPPQPAPAIAKTATTPQPQTPPQTAHDTGKDTATNEAPQIEDVGLQPMRQPTVASPATPPPASVPPPSQLPPATSPPPAPPPSPTQNWVALANPIPPQPSPQPAPPTPTLQIISPSNGNNAPPGAPGQPGPPGPPSQSDQSVPSSDKESDPFSDTNAFHFVNGKVSARNGRWVKTIKPRITQAGWTDAVKLADPSVTFLATVDEQGNVIAVVRYRSSGSDNIDLPCEEALNQWKIEPSKDKDGKPVKDVVAVTFGME